MLWVTMRMVLTPKRQIRLFDRLCSLGIEGGAWLVHQQHCGLHRQEPGDAELLLCLEAQTNGGLVQLVLQLIPERRTVFRLLSKS